MPLFYQQDINFQTRLAIWHIQEPERFFLEKVPLKKDITHPHKRLQHLAGRYLLSFLFPDFPYEEILIADSRKPFLENETYHFSISHCADYAAAIVSSTHRVGIDIELFTEKTFRVKDKFLNEPEKIFCQQYSFRKELLTTLWCAKEAAYKWDGDGKMDFRNHIRLRNFPFKDEGEIATILERAEKQAHLNIHFYNFSKMALAWVLTESKNPAKAGFE